MTSVRLTSLVLAPSLALAIGACGVRGPQASVREPAPRRVLEIKHLCDDAQFQSMCTPVPGERPMQVDTNLETPHRANASFAG